MNTLNTKTLLTIKTDKDLKHSAKDIADTIGIPLGTIINSFLRQFVRNKELNLSIYYTPTDELVESLVNIENDFKLGKFGGKAKSTNELFRKLKI